MSFLSEDNLILKGFKKGIVSQIEIFCDGTDITFHHL